MTFKNKFESPIKARREQLRPRGSMHPHEIFPITKINNK
jgi:hypothetical protein